MLLSMVIKIVILSPKRRKILLFPDIGIFEGRIRISSLAANYPKSRDQCCI
jgi:hypothetical protein